MLDPVPPPAPFLVKAIQPLANALSLPTLPYHIHEILFALVLYQSTQSLFSPVLSNYLFPDIYPKLNRRTRINWDVHVVSMLQSCLINILALYVMFNDEERYQMKDSYVERVYGYTGACGLIQGLATGYFLWDLVVSTQYLSIFGLGILAHAITALLVFSLGFRPFANYYGPVFILYELSTPFLNVHWFCDKLNMTGSKLQWYNGMILLAVFFGCRLVWGTYQSIRVYRDMWSIISMTPASPFPREIRSSLNSSIFVPRDGQVCMGKTKCVSAQAEVMRMAMDHNPTVPQWLALTYLVSNLVLNGLNFYWYGRMVQTVRKRFQGTEHDESMDGKESKRRRSSVVEEAATQLDHEVLSGPKTPHLEKMPADVMATGVSNGAARKRRG